MCESRERIQTVLSLQSCLVLPLIFFSLSNLMSSIELGEWLISAREEDTFLLGCVVCHDERGILYCYNESLFFVLFFSKLVNCSKQLHQKYV